VNVECRMLDARTRWTKIEVDDLHVHSFSAYKAANREQQQKSTLRIK
jgi:hypothetical protein